MIFASVCSSAPHFLRFGQSAAYLHRICRAVFAHRRFFCDADSTVDDTRASQRGVREEVHLGRGALGRHVGTDERQSEISTTNVGLVENAKYSEVKAGDAAGLLQAVTARTIASARDGSACERRWHQTGKQIGVTR
jgi:hypothetical protein